MLNILCILYFKTPSIYGHKTKHCMFFQWALLSYKEFEEGLVIWLSALAAVLHIRLDMSRDVGPSLIISVEGREALEARGAPELFLLETKLYQNMCGSRICFLRGWNICPIFRYILICMGDYTVDMEDTNWRTKF